MATVEQAAVDVLKEKLGDKILEIVTPRPRRAFVLVKHGFHRDAVSLLLERFERAGISAITGIDLGDEIELNYHMRCHGAVITIKSRVSKEKPQIETITDLIAGATLYEQEVFDLLGVVFEKHPNLKRLLLSEDWPEGSYPLRKDWNPQDVKENPYNVHTGSSKINDQGLDGTTCTTNVVIGPQHPALLEPERFLFKVDGEVVVDVEPRLGYVHRGIEKGAESLTFLQDVHLIERICGICNVSHTTCFCQAVESVGEIEIPSRAKYLRTIVVELNRIHSHLLLLGTAGLVLGYESLFQYMFRDREPTLDLMEMITGNRVVPAFNTIGGVRRDLKPGLNEKIENILERFEKRMRFYKDVFQEDPTMRLRTEEVGVLKKSDALKLCVAGPVLRGSGIKMDVRKDDAYAAYDEIPFNMITYKECDSWARLMVRVDEIVESINIIRYAAEHLPSGPYRVKVPRKQPKGEALSRVEAPRGELVHYVKSADSVHPYRVKVRSPTLANIISFREIAKGGYVADIPTALISLDPCFACMDRMVFLDVNSNRSWSWRLEEMKGLKGEVNGR